jgi:hypothetical protein
MELSVERRSHSQPEERRMSRFLVGSICLAVMFTAIHARSQTTLPSLILSATPRKTPPATAPAVSPNLPAAPSPREVLFCFGDRLRAGDREGAIALLIPRIDESNTLQDDEMRRWSYGALDFVVLDQHIDGDVAIFPIVWTGNTGADAKVLVRRDGQWKVCYLPDYSVLTGYRWTDTERAVIVRVLGWFYDHNKAFDYQAARVTTRQGRWTDRPAGEIHSRIEADPDWRRKRGLRETPAEAR